jgi:branched-chain amino acid transport system substrate-binding protein
MKPSMKKPAGRAPYTSSCRFAFAAVLILLTGMVMQAQDVIKIGLLIPDAKATAARQGAQLAVDQMNRKGGCHGKPFRIAIRNMDGPWGTGSKQAVDLIFTEKAVAILVSNDGRNAHLAEQAVTKTQVPMISAWSGDPTLSQAFVPWFFTCIPNNLQQAAAMADEIYSRKKFSKVCVVTDDQYDSQSAATAFNRKIRELKLPEPVSVVIKTGDPVTPVVNQVKSAGSQALVVFCAPATALKVLRQLKAANMNLPVYGNSFSVNEDTLTPEEINTFTHTFRMAVGTWNGPVRDAFVTAYEKQYAKHPGPVAAFMYDAATAMMEAINKGGTDRLAIQQALMKLQFTGTTGPVRFDSKGNRTGTFTPVMLTKGLPDPL